jgi:hypothetical protein
MNDLAGKSNLSLGQLEYAIRDDWVCTRCPRISILLGLN